MADAFTRRRLRTVDRLMADNRLTPSARVVGYEIFRRVNRVTGDAWPAQRTIAGAVGLNIKTVKRAVTELRRAGYFRARRDGRFNRYTPTLDAEQGELPVERESHHEQGTKTGLDRGQKRAVPPHRIGDKNGPQYPSSRTPLRTPAPYEPLREQRGDEILERKAIELFDRTGTDGFEVVSRLHELQDGQPRLRLFRLIRDGQVTERDLAAAKLAASHGARR